MRLRHMPAGTGSRLGVYTCDMPLCLMERGFAERLVLTSDDVRLIDEVAPAKRIPADVFVHVSRVSADMFV
jgi:hypothetical protein